MEKTLISSLAVLFVAAAFMVTLPAEAQAKNTFVTIGTGGITGVYYPTGGAIAKMVNAKRDKYGIRATVESTGGSVFNTNAIMVGDTEFGVAQSDRQFQGVKGPAEWEGMGPQKDLRAVFSIHAENVDLIAAEDANINSIQDLKGKRVNIGNIGSGYRQNAIDALEANGLDYEKDFHAESLKAAEAPGMIQDGRMDAGFYTVGHPSGHYKEATAGTRKVKFIEIPNVDKIVKKYPYYGKSVTLIKDYPGAANKEDIPTFGVKATFVISAKVPDEVVYAVTKEVFDNFEEFKKLHPAYEGLTKEGML
ncbi:MAG: TAXI family TRAP transporter solute-binding subunit [Desulfobacterales bacterium]